MELLLLRCGSGAMLKEPAKRRAGEKKERIAAKTVALRCNTAPTKNNRADMAAVFTWLLPGTRRRR